MPSKAKWVLRNLDAAPGLPLNTRRLSCMVWPRGNNHGHLGMPASSTSKVGDQAGPCHDQHRALQHIAALMMFLCTPLMLLCVRLRCGSYDGSACAYTYSHCFPRTMCKIGI